MTEVDKLYVGPAYKTDVYISEKVRKKLYKDKNIPSLLAKLKKYATDGFDQYTSKKGPIRYERKGVYRIGLHGDLFRVLGFYDGARNVDFIAITAFKKTGQKLNASDRAKVDDVSKIQSAGWWKKRWKK